MKVLRSYSSAGSGNDDFIKDESKEGTMFSKAHFYLKKGS